MVMPNTFGRAARRDLNSHVSLPLRKDLPYERNPYVGYDDIRTKAFLFDEVTDSRVFSMKYLADVDSLPPPWAFPFHRAEVGTRSDS